MNTIELNKTDRVDITYGDVTLVTQTDDYIEFIHVSDEQDPEYKCIWIASGNDYQKISFKNRIRFQISGDIEVFCEDWMEDENIPKSSLDASWMRWNEISEVMEFNHDRSIGSSGYDLPADYINHLDLEFANIDKLYFDEKYGSGKFLLVLHASFNDPESKTTMGFYTGPFRFYSERVKLIVE